VFKSVNNVAGGKRNRGREEDGGKALSKITPGRPAEDTEHSFTGVKVGLLDAIEVRNRRNASEAWL
jgi:hypothetical protein